MATGSKKTLDDYFCDWEGDTFGFGYGTGEAHVLEALFAFFRSLTDDRSYSHESMSAAMGPQSAWLLINALAHASMIEYGTSARQGWLTPQGERLRDYLQTCEDPYGVLMSRTQDSDVCYRNVCSCGDDGPCDNPLFWDPLRKPRWVRGHGSTWYHSCRYADGGAS